MSKLLGKIKKIGGDAELYQAVFDKCATPQKLTGDEYSWGVHLSTAGLMTIEYRPV